jgi:hypothetical protein
MLSNEELEKFYKLFKKVEPNYQKIVLIEELSETIKELTKSLRNKERYDLLIEELTHVQISLFMLQRTLNIQDSEFQKELNKKIINFKNDYGRK